MSTLEELTRHYHHLEAIRNETRKQARLIEADLNRNAQNQVDLYSLLAIVNKATVLIQNLFKGKVEHLITLALKGVFPRPVDFGLDFVQRQSRTDAIPYVTERGQKRNNVKDDVGGSLLDIVSFGLKIILWSMENPRSRNTLVLDEPMKWLGRYRTRAAQMMKEVSELLGLQLIVVTHDPEIMEVGDVSFLVEHDGVKSVVKRK